jgi:hypothetical protein
MANRSLPSGDKNWIGYGLGSTRTDQSAPGRRHEQIERRCSRHRWRVQSKIADNKSVSGRKILFSAR